MNQEWKIISVITLLLCVAVGCYCIWIYNQAYAPLRSAIDPSNGKKVMCNHVMILVKPQVSQVVATGFANGIRASVTGKTPFVDGFSIYVPGKCNFQTINSAVNYFKSKPGVISASAVKMF
jgi:hypothetical protein